VIDVHHHFNPPGLPGGGRPDWSITKALDDMDKAGISAALGYPGLVPHHLCGPACTAHARRLNAFGAESTAAAPQRLGLFAALPMADADAALREVAWLDDNIPHDGYGIATNYGDLWLGDGHFDPIWSELDRRAACVFVHPTDAPCCTPGNLSYHQDRFTGPWLEWPMNTARTLFSLITNGTFRRFPNVRFIFCHGGGLFGQLIGRLEGLHAWHPIGQAQFQMIFPRGIREEIAKLYFECAQAMTPENFEFIRRLMPDTQLLFGSDYDRFPQEHAVAQFNALNLAADAKAQIAYCNATRLFPRLAAAVRA